MIRVALVALVAIQLGCIAAPGRERGEPATPSLDATAPMPDAAVPDVSPSAELTAFCGTDPFQPRRGPIDRQTDLVDLLNALPRPLTLPCMLAALPRPLNLVATNSIISLQPAEGRLNPRIFLRSGLLILSIALAGTQSTHIETAEPAEVGFSVKGDLGFPRTDPVVERDFFDKILVVSGGTVCAACHNGENEQRKVDGIPAYSSRAFKPLSSEVVPLTTVRALADACDPDDSGLRCQMLRAVFRAPDAVGDMQFLEGTTTWR